MAARSGKGAKGCVLGCVLVLLALLTPALASAATQVSISPLNRTPDASPYTQISFLGVPANEIADVSVIGSRSGRHAGKLASYVSAPGASFLLSHPLAQGETVTATALVGPRGQASRVRTTFTVARLADYPIRVGPPFQLSGHGGEQVFQSQPRLRPPVVRVTRNFSGTSPGDIFLTPTHGYGQTGAMILDPQGRLVWFHPVPKSDDATNFQVQTYRGQPVLVFWEGLVPGQLGVGFGRDEILDSSYRKVLSVNAGNGYQADLHEFQLTPSGSAYLTAYTLVDADLSSAGGPRDGVLQDAVMQLLDVQTGLVMFEWHAYGHVALSDSYSKPPSGAGEPFDYFHVNSISPDPWGDGNFIVSSRNTWAAYEINHLSGAVVWRLGGRHSSFKMGPGTGTAYQHDVRWLPDRTLTIFDNGATPKVHSESRIIHEQIDWASRTVRVIGRYASHVVSGSQGNSQTLENGDSFVGWGESPYFTEYTPDGQIVFNANFPYPGQSYRAYRFPWSATPASQPALAVKAGSGGTVTAYASWNGATAVSAWRVLAGADAASMSPVAEVPKSGFETAIPLSSGAASFAVQAVGSEGQVLGGSGAVAR